MAESFLIPALWLLRAAMSFGYIRIVAILARAVWPSRDAGFLRREIVDRIPSLLMAALFIYLVRAEGVRWISEIGAWASLVLDGWWIAQRVPERRLIRALQTHPAAVQHPVVCTGGVPRFVGEAFAARMSDLIFRRMRANWIIVLSPRDVIRYGLGDVRVIDAVHVPSVESCAGELFVLPSSALRRWAAHVRLPERTPSDTDPPLQGLTSAQNLFSVPHLQFVFEQELGPMELRGLFLRSHQFHVMNRHLNLRLPIEAWAASVLLCCVPPRVIATSWRQFHFQESVRLRIVTLLNTADLVQRLVAIRMLTVLRDCGALESAWPADEPLLRRGSFGDWNRTIELGLQLPVGAPLEALRRLLLAPRDDWDELMKEIAPVMRQVWAGDFQPSARSTLAAWRLLGDLRNALVGHGNVGTAMTLSPRLHLGALHAYFLRIVRRLLDLELEVDAFRPPAQPAGDDVYVGADTGILGFGEIERADADCDATLNVDDRAISARPYLRFQSGRLLILNRILDGAAEYVDFLPDNIAEPSYQVFPVPPGAFVAG
jgi:hypothetical protein